MLEHNLYIRISEHHFGTSMYSGPGLGLHCIPNHRELASPLDWTKHHRVPATEWSSCVAARFVSLDIRAGIFCRSTDFVMILVTPRRLLVWWMLLEIMDTTEGGNLLAVKHVRLITGE